MVIVAAAPAVVGAQSAQGLLNKMLAAESKRAKGVDNYLVVDQDGANAEVVPACLVKPSGEIPMHPRPHLQTGRPVPRQNPDGPPTRS